MTTRRVFRILKKVCTDCGGACRDRDYYDPDNRDNAAGVPACSCRPRRLTPVQENY